MTLDANLEIRTSLDLISTFHERFNQLTPAQISAPLIANSSGQVCLPEMRATPNEARRQPDARGPVAGSGRLQRVQRR